MDITVLNNIIINILVTLLASSGFWAYVNNYREKKTVQSELLVGLAHDRLVTLCLKYMTRKWLTQDEYENLTVYLYQPYLKMGGNGTVKRLMAEVDKLPIRKDKFMDELTGDTIQ